MSMAMVRKRFSESQPDVAAVPPDTWSYIAKTGELEWCIGEENPGREEDWRAMQSGTRQGDFHVALAGRRTWSRFALVLGMLVVLLSGALYYLWETANTGMEKIEHELQTVIDLEAWTDELPVGRAPGALSADVAAGDLPPSLFHQGVIPVAFPETDSQISAQLIDVSFVKDLAVVQVRITRSDSSGQTSAFRHLQFYHRAGTQWFPTSPDAGYWGPAQTLETDNFIFTYPRRSANVVAETAAGLDTTYTLLRNDYGLPPTDEKLMVEILPSEDSPIYGSVQNGKLRLPLPALFPIPDGWTQPEILSQWLLDALVRHAQNESEWKRRALPSWHNAIDSIYQWQVRRRGVLLETWHGELNRWLYEATQDSLSGKHPAAASELSHLCSKHNVRDIEHLLAMTPAVAICGTPPQAALAELGETGPPDRLDRLGVPYISMHPLGDDDRWNVIQATAVGTVFDYVVLAYGNARLLDLWQGFTRYERWQELIPAVFGISAEDFEAGWQEYLELTY